MVTPNPIENPPLSEVLIQAVIGGSGNLYETLALALAGEIAAGETGRETGLVPQAGTVAGSLVGPGSLSAVNDFYKDWYVVNTDTTPTNGLASQWARVASYDGATRTMTLDKPWDFSAESDFALVKPARLTLLEDLTEDFDATSCVELNLAGHRLEGEIDCSAEEFHRISGAGYVTNGIYKQAFGVLLLENLKISRRSTEIYCVLMTEDSNLGRCELYNCQFAGRVSGRRGYCGWRVDNCTNDGVLTVSLTQNLGYTLVESIPGVAVVVSAADFSIDSEIGGSLFYSENSITGPAAYISMNMVVRSPLGILASTVTSRSFSLFMASGAATLTIAYLTGSCVISIGNFRSLSSAGVIASIFSVVRVTTAFSGVATIALTQAIVVVVSQEGVACVVMVEGAGDVSGAITVSGSTVAFRAVPQVGALRVVFLNARLTGSISISSALPFTGSTFQGILYNASQDSGAPSITISGAITAYDIAGFVYVSFSAGFTVSVGTYTISGTIAAIAILPSNIGNWTTVVSGGTWTISSALTFMITNGVTSYSHVQCTMTGGTVTLSGVNGLSKPSKFRTGAPLVLVEHAGSGGTAVISGQVVVTHWYSGGNSMRLATATVSGGTANVTGTVAFFSCASEGTFIGLNAAAGASVTGPTSVTFDLCYFSQTVTMTAGAGTITWAGASLLFRSTHVEGLFTLVGTNFATVQAFLSTFNGNSTQNSISFTGTRPTTYRFWKCVFNGIPNAAGQPEIIDDYVVRPAVGALAKGNLLTINAAGQAAAMGALTVLEGVCLEAAAGAGSRTVVVRRGVIYVDSDAGVVAGDNCNADVAGVPTNQITAAAAAVGIRSGRALEAAGATVAGEAYSVVDLR